MEASFVLREAVGLLSEPECGAAIVVLGTALRRLASWRTRAASSRSELAIEPWGLVEDTKLVTMLGVKEVTKPDSDLS